MHDVLGVPGKGLLKMILKIDPVERWDWKRDQTEECVLGTTETGGSEELHSSEGDHVGATGNEGVLLRASGQYQALLWILGKVSPGRDSNIGKEVVLHHL